jgi:hypothetical protein
MCRRQWGAALFHSIAALAFIVMSVIPLDTSMDLRLLRARAMAFAAGFLICGAWMLIASSFLLSYRLVFRFFSTCSYVLIVLGGPAMVLCTSPRSLAWVLCCAIALVVHAVVSVVRARQGWALTIGWSDAGYNLP